MKRRTIYITLAGLSVVLIAAVEIPERQYLNERLDGYRSERAAIERLERDYRRPVLDEPVEQNAATWYARALPNLTKTPISALQSALDAGAARYDLATESLLSGPCAEAVSDRVQTALRCSYCDWQLGFGTVSDTRFKYSREALTLSRCLTVAGHRSAHQGSVTDAARRYLEGLAVGCDLGHGSEAMLVVSLAAVRENLTALGRLAAASNDALFLRRLAADLSLFEGRLPDGRGPLRRALLWTQNEVALQELEAGYQSGGFGLIGLKTVMAAQALRNDEAVFDYRTPAKLKSDVDNSASEIVRTANLPRTANLATSALALADAYRAVLAATDLQQRKTR
ncbi:MAG TPA: hypothetical protein VGY57_02210 [Vicinamibacterales bacterium]|nr:hypothetical protein [Vicinamibacterales bacterium]